MTRTTKTPRQRAEETLATAERRLKKADALVTRLEAESGAARRDREQALVRRDYAKRDPALAPTTSTGDNA